MVEACWSLNDVSTEVEISIKATKTQTNSAQKAKSQETNLGKQSARNRRTQGALTISTEGSSYAEVLKRLKEKVNEKELGVDINGVRESNDGLRLQFREKNKGGQSRLVTFTSEEMKINASHSGQSRQIR